MSRLGLTLLLCLVASTAASLEIQEHAGIVFDAFLGTLVKYDVNATRLNDTALDAIRQDSYNRIANIRFGKTSVDNGLSTDRIVPLRPSDLHEMPTVFYDKYVELMELQMRTIAALQYLQQKLGTTQ
jgi:hypothetical protein